MKRASALLPQGVVDASAKAQNALASGQARATALTADFRDKAKELPKGVADASTRAQTALASGHASATALAGDLGDKAKEKIHQKVAATYGDDFFEMLQALVAITQRMLGELKVTEMKYGLMLALPLIHLEHDTLPLPLATGELMERPELAEQASHWASFALAAYGAKNSVVGRSADDVERVSRRLEGFGADVKMAYLPSAGVQCPGHFVAVDAPRRSVVLGVRGTVNISDAITDAAGDSVVFPEFPGVETHQAILASAREVLGKTRDALSAAVEAHADFDVVVTGHSLGAGTAILCALLLSAEPLLARPKVRCFAFAPPPLISEVTSTPVRAVEIYAFVNRHDVVPRISLHNVYMLGLEAVAVDKLDLSFADRIRLIRQGKAPADETQERLKVMSAVAAARQKAKLEPHDEFTQHYIPGEVFWINGEADPPKVVSSECIEFQGLLLRGGRAILEDHRMPNYVRGLEASLPAMGAVVEPKEFTCAATSKEPESAAPVDIQAALGHEFGALALGEDEGAPSLQADAMIQPLGSQDTALAG